MYASSLLIIFLGSNDLSEIESESKEVKSNSSLLMNSIEQRYEVIAADDTS
ncbi:hypothetical protein D3C78_1907930 [compost metagenome]